MISFSTSNHGFVPPTQFPQAKSAVVISDTGETASSLASSLSAHSIEVVHLFPDALKLAEIIEPMMVILDVQAELLPGALKMLRSNSQLAGIPILVEAGRVIDRHAVSGILSYYRAMPCSHADLMRLARRLASGTASSEGRNLL